MIIPHFRTAFEGFVLFLDAIVYTINFLLSFT